MRRLDSKRTEPLHGTAATRSLERATAAELPPHALMARAGLSIASLTRALAPHARRIWVACGPGNNGGDGLVAATWLHQHSQASGLGLSITTTLVGDLQRLPKDAAHAWKRAQAAGLSLSKAPPDTFDFAIDALLGIGATRPMEGELSEQWDRLVHATAPVLSVDVPSGLKADTGALLDPSSKSQVPAGPRFTLSLLTLKPGLFTAQGRDFAGEVWFDDLAAPMAAMVPPDAWLQGQPGPDFEPALKHATHKGKHGEVLVLGGQSMETDGIGMSGAAILAARAALHAGAGRVYLSLIQATAPSLTWDPVCPELMLRSTSAALSGDLVERSTVVCGCGGGRAVADFLPALLERAPMLVLDADALNAIADNQALQQLLEQRRHRAWTTVVTPHPLEAARLLAATTETVMTDRLASAQSISERWGVICVLKGSGSVISAPGVAPLINASGNGSLATAGTGDVLAGMIGAALASPGKQATALRCVAAAVFQHGHIADHWIKNQGRRHLSASQLATGRSD
ncbi:NAD(P)H-hydrate dehydratase [Hydrogenophaga sp. PAMC20947]|uniref:NAD(P)H-hydrate dehydratase n=1 Tax=Hydrogenophaga sp. PAMC20947 TaxID=2565558 RepID=UPI00109E258F|nr:NAD(P)H-hydrate dehydratase [Hydrogenophaga sp. PAMC20947]QCB45205.1 NAD(P)H-hydrate dehydratase [Hydrogenophaga sp. PAMC20947]